MRLVAALVSTGLASAKKDREMGNRLLLAALLATFSCASVSASDATPDGDQFAECYASYDAMVGLGESGKIPTEEKAGYETKRSKVEALALAQYQVEGLDEENARGQLKGRGEYMRGELREIHNGTGIYSADEMKKIASDCDALVGG